MNIYIYIYIYIYICQKPRTWALPSPPSSVGGADERDALHDVRADERDAGYCRVPARVTAAPGVGIPH